MEQADDRPEAWDGAAAGGLRGELQLRRRLRLRFSSMAEERGSDLGSSRCDEMGLDACRIKAMEEQVA